MKPYSSFQFVVMAALLLSMLLSSFALAPAYAADGSEQLTSDNMAACQGYPQTPTNSGTKVQGKGYARCDVSSYHTFKVCLRKVRSFMPDQEVACKDGSGTWQYSLTYYPTGCAGPGSYFSETTLDGVKNASSRTTLNCS